MNTRKICIIGSPNPIRDDTVSKAYSAFAKIGYTISTESELPCCDSDKKILAIHLNDEIPTKTVDTWDLYDAVFFIGSDSSEHDKNLICAWTGHPHLRIIGDRFPDSHKADRLIREIRSFLGEPEPLEIERKFLIEYPNTAYLATLPYCRKVEISQTYLTDSDGGHARVRRRGEFGNCLYYHTVKKRISNARRIEIERRITEAEYNGFLSDPSLSKRRIEKDRYCISYDSQYFELDVFPFWDDRAILEIELCHEDDEIRFPEWITIIKEVTDDRSYNNSALAKDVL